MWDLKSYECKTTIPTYEVLEAICVISSGTAIYKSLLSQKPKKGKRNTKEVYFMTAGERGIVRIWNSEG